MGYHPQNASFEALTRHFHGQKWRSRCLHRRNENREAIMDVVRGQPPQGILIKWFIIVERKHPSTAPCGKGGNWDLPRIAFHWVPIIAIAKIGELLSGASLSA